MTQESSSATVTVATPAASRTWLLHAAITTILWGVWGALIELPEKAGFPATLGYVAWGVTMIPVAAIALRTIGWHLDVDRRSLVLGMSAGLMGCGGQLILFQCLRLGPAYIVFPLISLYPVITVALSVMFLKEHATRRAWTGIVLALVAIGLLSYQAPGSTAVVGYLWLLLAVIVFLLWGVQAFIMKFASDPQRAQNMKAESVTFYLMASSLVLAPIALAMTDFSASINWGPKGMYSALLVQMLNAVGFLFFAYAIRYGRAIIVVPLMSLAPVVTVVLSLILYSVVPHPVILCGMVCAMVSIFLLAE
ncbi:MAG TPA: DMT family transporter [Bacteroidota bacterium]|nr:DMT family transporter [Bacteroidota bacterium]